DFSNDGRLDVASVNPTTNEVAVAPGNGDGTLRSPLQFPVGAVPYVMMVDAAKGEVYTQRTSSMTAAPVALVAGDFNGDGRLDLATANFASHDVSFSWAWGTARCGRSSASRWERIPRPS